MENDFIDLGVFLGAAIAIIGWFVTRHQALQFEKRKERLELVNKRLDDFYGPLYVATRAGEVAYDSLLAHQGTKESLFTGASLPSEEELKEWHHWMSNVLLPLNDVIEKAILDNAYLVIEEEMPQCLIDYMSHVATTRSVVAHWDAGNYSDKTLPIPYPESLDEYISESYAKLKAEQLELVGFKNERRI